MASINTLCRDLSRALAQLGVIVAELSMDMRLEEWLGRAIDACRTKAQADGDLERGVEAPMPETPSVIMSLSPFNELQAEMGKLAERPKPVTLSLAEEKLRRELDSVKGQLAESQARLKRQREDAAADAGADQFFRTVGRDRDGKWPA